MRGLGSIPGWLLVPVAFVVLVVLRFVSLDLGKYQARDHKSTEGEGGIHGSCQVDTVHRG